MEVTLLHFTVHDVDVAEGRPSQSISEAAFYLPLDTEGIHREATVHHADNAIDSEITILGNCHFDCLSNR